MSQLLKAQIRSSNYIKVFLQVLEIGNKGSSKGYVAPKSIKRYFSKKFLLYFGKFSLILWETHDRWVKTMT